MLEICGIISTANNNVNVNDKLGNNIILKAYVIKN